MHLVTAREMRLIEQAFTKEAGLPSAVLMESAGAAVARSVAERVAAPGRVLVLCGHGANGGDGFVAARHLAIAGYDVAVWLAGEEGRLDGDAALMWRALQGTGVQIVEWDGRADALADAIRQA
uniref:NAD(P)H-hydrate epimerase n=1 Tax=Calditerricola satsumensis TaxID=373054 RepID=UPI000A77E20E